MLLLAMSGALDLSRASAVEEDHLQPLWVAAFELDALARRLSHGDA
jgi:hypothetical protein